MFFFFKKKKAPTANMDPDKTKQNHTCFCLGNKTGQGLCACANMCVCVCFAVAWEGVIDPSQWQRFYNPQLHVYWWLIFNTPSLTHFCGEAHRHSEERNTWHCTNTIVQLSSLGFMTGFDTHTHTHTKTKFHFVCTTTQHQNPDRNIQCKPPNPTNVWRPGKTLRVLKVGRFLFQT